MSRSIKANTLSTQELKHTLAVSIKCNLIRQETHFISNVDIEGSCISFLPIEMTVIHQLLFHFILLWCSISQRNALIFGKVYPLNSFPCCLSNKKYFLQKVLTFFAIFPVFPPYSLPVTLESTAQYFLQLLFQNEHIQQCESFQSS